MAGVPPITNREEFETWLRDKDLFLVAALANRRSLNALPLVLPRDAALVGATRRRRDIQAVWRAAAVARITILRSQFEISVDAGVALKTALRTHEYNHVVEAATFAGYSAYSAYSSSDGADPSLTEYGAYAHLVRNNVFDGAEGAINAIESAIAVYTTDLSQAQYEFWKAVSEDCQWCDSAPRTPAELLARPLWPDGTNGPFADRWAKFREAAATSDDWSEWIAWYDRKLRGHHTEWGLSAAGEAEMARRLVSLTDEEWKAAETEPATINLALRQWISELKAPGPLAPEAIKQNPRVVRFGGTSAGIGLIDQSRPADAPDADGFARRHALVRAALEALLAASDSTCTNATAVAEPVRNLLDALGASHAVVQPESYVLFSKELRRYLRDHLDPRSGDPPLTKDQTRTLERWIDADGMFVRLDDELAKAEQAVHDARYGPVDLEIAHLRALIGEAASSGAATPEAARVLETAIRIAESDAPDTPPDLPIAPADKDADLRTANQTTANFFRAMARWVQDRGPATVKGIWNLGNWMHKNAKWVEGLAPADTLFGGLLRWLIRQFPGGS